MSEFASPRDAISAEIINAAAEAIYERIFDECWKDLLPNSIDRALYTEAAHAGILAAIRVWQKTTGGDTRGEANPPTGSRT